MKTECDNANLDPETVTGFGDEWDAFDQSQLVGSEYLGWFEAYFRLFPWERLPQNAVGFDLGCGSGRWALGVAPRVGKLHCIDPADKAISVARKRLVGQRNVCFHQASVDAIPLPPGSQDFGYSLGVLHHVPDTAAALADCVSRLKIGAPFLLYLYYDFENRPAWFREIWKLSDLLRRRVSRLSFSRRKRVTDCIAAAVYLPLARAAWLAEVAGGSVRNWPLSAYRTSSFYTMRTDALDRFGTKLEKRFSRGDIESMMLDAGLGEIHFSSTVPYWVAVGVRQR